MSTRSLTSRLTDVPAKTSAIWGECCDMQDLADLGLVLAMHKVCSMEPCRCRRAFVVRFRRHCDHDMESCLVAGLRLH